MPEYRPVGRLRYDWIDSEGVNQKVDTTELFECSQCWAIISKPEEHTLWHTNTGAG